MIGGDWVTRTDREGIGGGGRTGTGAAGNRGPPGPTRPEGRHGLTAAEPGEEGPDVPGVGPEVVRNARDAPRVTRPRAAIPAVDGRRPVVEAVARGPDGQRPDDSVSLADGGGEG